MILPIGRFISCANGEIIEPVTGVVVGFDDFYQEPPLSTDAQTLLRYWDGMSVEPLGTIPKIISISREEQRLLSKIRPLKWLKYAAQQDYMALLDKINSHKISLYQSIRMKNMWKNPNSVFNSTEFRLNMSLNMIALRADPDSVFNGFEYRQNTSRRMVETWAIPGRRQSLSRMLIAKWADPNSGLNPLEYSVRMKAAWADPNGVYRSSEYRDSLSTALEAAWADPDSVFNTPEYRETLSKANKLAKNTPESRKNSSIVWKKILANPRVCRRRAEAVRRSYTWKCLAQSLDMLFGGIVDEDAETYPCPHCNRVFASRASVGQHRYRCPVRSNEKDLSYLI